MRKLSVFIEIEGAFEYAIIKKGGISRLDSKHYPSCQTL